MQQLGAVLVSELAALEYGQLVPGKQPVAWR